MRRPMVQLDQLSRRGLASEQGMEERTVGARQCQLLRSWPLLVLFSSGCCLLRTQRSKTVPRLPKPWRPDGVKTLTTAPAPAPDMTSESVLSAQPKAVHDTSPRVSAAARAARAEALPRNTRFTAPAAYPQNSNLFDRFSIKG